MKPSDIHSSLHSYVLCIGILFLISHFQPVAPLNISYPHFPWGFDAPNYSHQVPLQLSYEDLRPKPNHLTIELSVMTLRNVRNGGPTRPEVCFLSTLIPKRREMATQYHQGISTAEPRHDLAGFHPVVEPAPLFHPFCS